MHDSYAPHSIEEAVQRYWEENHCFQATEAADREKFYCLTMFPYPSGRLHVGHARNYLIGDVIARYQRMLGKNVLQPMGWDAFGLPAENAAHKHKVPPAEWTYKNIDFMRAQMKRLGLGYDWSRELTTCRPEYYQWEQWFFLKLYEKGLVYKKKAEVNWDPVDQTVLANEQVVEGRGWRSGALIERREIPQWFFKITAYAEELLNAIDQLSGWPEAVRTIQRHWIGRSDGAEITFAVEKSETPLTIFTTRPDTLFGVTYIAIAPQHPLAKHAGEIHPDIHQFLEECKKMKVAEAEVATVAKRGLATGFFAVHPLTQEKLPIWVANFVLMEYGSGAVMAVPAHDQRDFEFAQQYGLPIQPVIAPLDQTLWNDKQAYTGLGELMNSGPFSGLTSEQALPQILHYLENHGIGQRKIHYRIRDWSISRQRYWGAPIPIIYCEQCGTVPVPEQELPVRLPEEIKFTSVVSPLQSMPTFYETTCPHCHRPARRETDTFDTFVESSWYYARFAGKNQTNKMLDERANDWLPVDQYIGGIEHAVLHLLYARFFYKAMRDLGLVRGDEPFVRLINQGHVLNQGIKMSKSKGNVVDPDELIKRFGADTVRLFIMFAAPPEQSLEWSEGGVEGAYRFLKRLWSFGYERRELVHQQNKNSPDETHSIDWSNASLLQKNTLKQIFAILELAIFDYERSQFNTIVSGCMKLLNALSELPVTEDLYCRVIIHMGTRILLCLLAPIVPHITHQLWQDLQYPGLILEAEWPRVKTLDFKMDEIELVVQINGKLRSRITIPTQADELTIQTIATQEAKVKQAIAGLAIKKMIIVPGKLVNIVTEKK